MPSRFHGKSDEDIFNALVNSLGETSWALLRKHMCFDEEFFELYLPPHFPGIGNIEQSFVSKL